MRKPATLLALAALLTAVAVPVAGAARKPTHKHRKPPTKKVLVLDDVFRPVKLRIKRNTTLKWVWPDYNSDTHNVKLTGAPRHVRKFTSPSAAADFEYSRKLTRTGNYKFICVYHANMTMRVTVVR